MAGGLQLRHALPADSCNNTAYTACDLRKFQKLKKSGVDVCYLERMLTLQAAVVQGFLWEKWNFKSILLISNSH